MEQAAPRPIRDLRAARASIPGLALWYIDNPTLALLCGWAGVVVALPFLTLAAIYALTTVMGSSTSGSNGEGLILSGILGGIVCGLPGLLAMIVPMVVFAASRSAKRLPTDLVEDYDRAKKAARRRAAEKVQEAARRKQEAREADRQAKETARQQRRTEARAQLDGILDGDEAVDLVLNLGTQNAPREEVASSGLSNPELWVGLSKTHVVAALVGEPAGSSAVPLRVAPTSDVALASSHEGLLFNQLSLAIKQGSMDDLWEAEWALPRGTDMDDVRELVRRLHDAQDGFREYKTWREKRDDPRAQAAAQAAQAEALAASLKRLPEMLRAEQLVEVGDVRAAARSRIEESLGDGERLLAIARSGDIHLGLTNRNVARYSPRSFESIGLSAITSVRIDESGWLIPCELTVSAGAQELTFPYRSEIRDHMSLVGDRIRALTGLKSERVNAPRPAADIPEQIKKLAELRDAGVISEEDFLQKKADLLARM